MDDDDPGDPNRQGGGSSRPYQQQDLTPRLGQGGGGGAIDASQSLPVQVRGNLQFGSLDQAVQAVAQGHYQQQQQPIPIPLMGSYMAPASMTHQGPSQPTYVGSPYNPQQGFSNPINPNTSWGSFNTTPIQPTYAAIFQDPAMMEVDEGAQRPRAPTPPPVPRGSPSNQEQESERKKGKRPERKPEASTSHRRNEEWSSVVDDVRQRLIDEGIDVEFLDFIEVNSAALVVTQLLDRVEEERHAAARERSRAELLSTQLKNERKRMLPSSPSREEGPSSRPLKLHQTEQARHERTLAPMPRRDTRPPSPRRRSERQRSPEPFPAMERSYSDALRTEGPPEASLLRRRERLEEYLNYSKNDPSGRNVERRDDRRPSTSAARSTRPQEPRREARPLAPTRSIATASSKSSAAVAFPKSQKVNPANREGGRREVTAYRVPPAAPGPPAWVLKFRPGPQPTTPVAGPSTARVDERHPDEAVIMSDDGASTDEDKPKSSEKVKGKETFLANQLRKIENEEPGHIAQEMEVVVVQKRHERCNRLWDMLGPRLYWSPYENRVYALEEAHRASVREVRQRDRYRPTHAGRLYAIVPRGFPMNPREVQVLYDHIFRTKKGRFQLSIDERCQGYELLTEFIRIAQRIHPSIRDRAMNAAMDLPLIEEQQRPRGNFGTDPWFHPPVERPAGALSAKTTGKTRGAGLSPPTGSDIFDQERVAQYILHHGRPGSKNWHHGIAMDYAHRVAWETVFGLTLTSILAPVSNHYRTSFMRVLVSIMARPYLYHEAVEAHNAANPDRPLRPIQRGEFTVTRFTPPEDRNLISEAMVNLHLIENGIPVEWIHHSYAFAIHWWNHSWPVDAELEAIYRHVDNQRLMRLDDFGIPPTIIQWSGWRYATPNDCTRLSILEGIEAEENGGDRQLGRDWLYVGESIYFVNLPNRRDLPSDDPMVGPSSASAPTGVATQPPVASSTATSTTVAAPSSAETPVDTMAAQSGPPSSAAASASAPPPLPVGADGTTQVSNMGEAPHPPADDPMDA